MAELAVLAELVPGIANQTTPATAIAPTAMCFSLMRAPTFRPYGTTAADPTHSGWPISAGKVMRS